MKIKIAPSLLSADQLNLSQAVKEVEDSGADCLHIDVMDGHFVPNLTFGLPLIQALKKRTQLPLDVHIMVTNPDTVAEAYVQAGADFLTFHIETSYHPYRIVQNIKKNGAKAGIALNPGTPVSHIEPLLDELDLVLLLSVNPGFSGQKFLTNVYDKLTDLRRLSEKNPKISRIIAVDGGVSTDNITKLASLGANYFVSGSNFFNATDKKTFIDQLRKNAQ